MNNSVNEKNEIKNRLKILRKEKGLSQVAFSKEIGIPLRTLQSWENGESQIKPDKAQALADHFGVPVGYLLGYSEDKKDVLRTSLELSRRDEDGEHIFLQDMVTLMDIAMLKGVDTRDKIVSNLKDYFDYYGKRMREDHEINDGDKFDAFLAKYQEDADEHIIMLLTGIVNLRDDIRLTLLDILAMEGEKLETIKNTVKFVANSNQDN
ncbi:helix-turn-helix transcriptional regulator [Streptococcus suis]|nr:helix-turn-helix transcriptional regulator [Streptococcus suis]NQP20128.1 helix-turn-helix transcriptional regulator [Streptococcus suis]